MTHGLPGAGGKVDELDESVDELIDEVLLVEPEDDGAEFVGLEDDVPLVESDEKIYELPFVLALCGPIRPVVLMATSSKSIGWHPE
jgi:hypothetical protein